MLRRVVDEEEMKRPNGTIIAREQRLVEGTRFPYAGGDFVEIPTSEVAALGKLTAYGSAATQFVLRLRDGRQVHVRADKQDKEVERWLRRIARPVRARSASREAGWILTWGEELVE